MGGSQFGASLPLGCQEGSSQSQMCFSWHVLTFLSLLRFADTTMRCTSFNNFNHATVSALRVLPPLDSKDKTVTWARGSIRDSDFNELIVTGPRLPVLFSGCRFNSIVFSIRGPGANDQSHDFENFLHSILTHVESNVTNNMEKYRPGLKNTALLHLDRDFIRPSSYGPDLPNELRVKLSVKRNQVDENGEVVELIDTVLVDENGDDVDPSDVSSGSEIIPIFRISYYRNANKFGLNLTMLKGMVFPGTKKQKMDNYDSLEFDFSV